MSARKYDREVVFLQATTERGPLNAPVETWAPITRAFASRTPVSDGERDRAAQVGAFRTDRFETWWTPGLSGLAPKDRIRCDGRTYDILSVRELGFQERLEISAKARAD